MREVLGKNGTRILTINRRKAIHERCLNCSGWFHKDVTNCPLIRCKLHPFRTGKGTQDAEARNKAIRGYCLDCMNNQVGETTKCPSDDCPLYIYRKGGLDRAYKAFIMDKMTI